MSGAYKVSFCRFCTVTVAHAVKNGEESVVDHLFASNTFRHLTNTDVAMGSYLVNVIQDSAGKHSVVVDSSHSWEDHDCVCIPQVVKGLKPGLEVFAREEDRGELSGPVKISYKMDLNGLVHEIERSVSRRRFGMENH